MNEQSSMMPEEVEAHYREAVRTSIERPPRGARAPSNAGDSCPSSSARTGSDF